MSVPPDPVPRGPVAMRLVVGLTVLVTAFAAAVAAWMYWLAALV